MIPIIVGLIAGAASTYQASVNGRIREIFRTPYLTAMLSFLVASSLMTLTILITEKSFYIPLGVIAGEPAWIWTGGVCGMAIVTLNIICLPRLGSARNVMIICFGQTMLGLVIDQWGLFYSPRIPMDLKRLAGAVLVIVGMAVFNGVRMPGIGAGSAEIPGAAQDSESRTTAATQDALYGTAIAAQDAEDGAPVSKESRAPVLYTILAVICGFACSMQIAVNGALRECAGSAVKATLISMAVGFISTGIAALLITALKGRMGIYDEGIPPERLILKPWMVFGGLLATVVVGGNAVSAPLIGTGIVTILNLVGMMAAGLIIDAAGFLGIEKKPVTAAKVAGMVMMTAGAAIISVL